MTDILGYFLALAVFDPIKKYGDIETALIYVFGPYDYAVTLNVNIFYAITAGDGQGNLNGNFSKRRYIFVQVAIGAYATDILGTGSKIISIADYLDG